MKTTHLITLGIAFFILLTMSSCHHRGYKMPHGGKNMHLSTSLYEVKNNDLLEQNSIKLLLKFS